MAKVKLTHTQQVDVEASIGGGKWSSSDPKVATVHPYQHGKMATIIARRPGTTVVSVVLPLNSRTRRRVKVTVVPAEAVMEVV